MSMGHLQFCQSNQLTQLPHVVAHITFGHLTALSYKNISAKIFSVTVCWP